MHKGHGGLVQWSDSPLLLFSTALGCIMPCPVQDAALCPDGWGRLTSSHFLLQGGFGNPQPLWMLVNPTCAAGTSSKFSTDVPCVWELGHHVCVEEAHAAAELLQLLCKAQETWDAALSA